jgi:hypothetical protein
VVLGHRESPEQVAAALVRICDRDARKNHLR